MESCPTKWRAGNIPPFLNNARKLVKLWRASKTCVIPEEGIAEDKGGSEGGAGEAVTIYFIRFIILLILFSHI
jgi:hypothetical protein